MKPISFLTAFLLTLSASATILQVDNRSSAPSAVYSTILLAHNAASNGDTIYIHGSATTYAVGPITKELHLFGDGYQPNSSIKLRTVLSGITFNALSAGSTLQGVKVNNAVTVADSNITISRCEVGEIYVQNTRARNILIYNNIILTRVRVDLNALGTNLLISNNIVSGFILSEGNLGANPKANALIANNLFMGAGAGDFAFSRGGTPSNSFVNQTVINNVFVYRSPHTPTTHNEINCNFSNNLSYQCSTGTFHTTGLNSGANNIVNTNPLFISNTNTTFETTDDFHYPSNSPLVNAGTDTKDIGIYGGSYPWPDGGISGSGFMYSQEARIPQVNLMNINTASVPQNGNLNVTITGISND